MDKPENQCRWCDDPEFSRGMCSRHYQRARRLAKQGKPCGDDDEPMAKPKGRPAKDTGKGIAWLAKLYDDLSRDVANALAHLERGDYTLARAVLMQDSNANELRLEDAKDKGNEPQIMPENSDNNLIT